MMSHDSSLVPAVKLDQFVCAEPFIAQQLPVVVSMDADHEALA
jgi:hypothetical protein